MEEKVFVIEGDTLTSYNGSEKDVVIPKGMTKIEAPSFSGSPFRQCETLESVLIPLDVTELGHMAFFRCKSLKSIDIPDSVTRIGFEAFEGCASLTAVSIPDGVTCIASGTFAKCMSLASIKIPGSVAMICERAFEDCASLTSVEYGDTMEEWELVNGKKGLLAYIPAAGVKCTDGIWKKPPVLVEHGSVAYLDKNVADVEIPAGIREIDPNAFRDCTSLASVIIPAGVMEIGPYAFAGCTSLVSVSIPASVRKIGTYAFSGCTSLEEVRYTGTKEEWAAVKKEANWKAGVPARKMTCADRKALFK